MLAAPIATIPAIRWNPNLPPGEYREALWYNDSWLYAPAPGEGKKILGLVRILLQVSKDQTP